MHIKSFGFRGLRKLNLNHDYHDDRNFKITNIDQFQASAINIIVGPNGGGKSTVVDLVRSIGDASVLPTIARENINMSTSSGFVVYLDNGKSLSALFYAVDLNEFGLNIGSTDAYGFLKETFSGNIKKTESETLPSKLHAVIKSLSAKIAYRNQHNEAGIPVQVLIDALNTDAKHLVGLAPFPLARGQVIYSNPESKHILFDIESPITLINDDIVSVSFNDDQLQHNHVPIDKLPAGWRAYGGLLAWLATQSTGSICVIEEPETHIHPKLLRIMMGRISELAKKLSLQIFITTHSSTLIDINTWPNHNVSLFEADGYQVRTLTDPSLALANLGVRPSDVCQANGVIWVEGSSDRLYIIHWLKLWCKQHKKEMPVENIDFSFVLYGGAMLNQFTATPNRDLIEIFKINLNSIVVMDRDLDFITNAAFENTPKKQSSTKAKIYNDIGSIADSSRYCWITHGYTIECYLPDNFSKKYYVLVDGRLKPITTVSKVHVAEKFRNKFSNFKLSHKPGCDLPVWIERLYNSIIAWNAI